jgi:hypothetical protein
MMRKRRQQQQQRERESLERALIMSAASSLTHLPRSLLSPPYLPNSLGTTGTITCGLTTTSRS